MLRDGAQFCPSCGAAAANPAQQQSQPQYTYQMNGMPVDPELQFDPQDVQTNKVNAVLSYFGILVLVPIFTAKNSKFARFHANQGLLLLICEVVYTTFYRILTGVLNAISSHLTFITVLFSLVYIVLFVFAVIGIASAAGGKAKKLPIIGDYTILK